MTVRGVDTELWKQIRIEAVRRDETVGDLINQIFRQWLSQPRVPHTAGIAPRPPA
jgi:hypothetical protein